MSESDHFKLKVIPSAYDFLPYGKYKICFGETLKGIQEDNEILYIMNNCGHRSDDFIQNHDGLHILFAGCSVTFGEGLPYMSNWSGKLYNKISKQIKTSGYFSLSFLGGDTTLIIANIYKYILKYGKPDIIFMQVPDTNRHRVYLNGEYHTMNRFINNDITETSKWHSYNSLIAFEMYCLSSNIKLLWTTWNESDNKFYKDVKMFKDFISISDAKVISMSKNKNERKSKYYKIARDKAHPGLMYSDGLSNIYYNELIKKCTDLNLY